MLKGNLTLVVNSFTLKTGEFSIPLSGITVLFGPSGCGKSTFLRAISGLSNNTQGTLHFNNDTWQKGKQSKPTIDRGIGFVFQDAALFPHLNVRGNLEYARHRSPNKNKLSVDDIARKVGIENSLTQNVKTLSGGEIQRVAIARALLSAPQLLCMDEPLSALDWPAKLEILKLISQIANETNLPIIYVTHATKEVEYLAANIVFMTAGHISRIETLAQTLARTDSPLFKEEGMFSVLRGTLGDTDEYGLQRFGNKKINLWLTGHQEHPNHKKYRLRILARDISIALDDPCRISILNHLPVSINQISEPINGKVYIGCKLDDGQCLLAQITLWSCRKLELKVGMDVFALVKTVSLMA